MRYQILTTKISDTYFDQITFLWYNLTWCKYTLNLKPNDDSDMPLNLFND